MRYYVVDAFAARMFAGNPAGVCIVDRPLEDDLMQKIAQENNLSETAFIQRKETGYQIRWFTPEYEIDLCGHATLGSAYVIHHILEPGIPEIRFESRSGVLMVQCGPEGFVLDFPSRPPVRIESSIEFETIIQVPVQEAYLSRDLVLVIEGEEAVRRLKPDFEQMKKLERGDGVIVTAQGTDVDFVARCFYPKCGVNEDPVTGSAYCNLIPYWAGRLGKGRLTARQLSARGATIGCELAEDRVKISGKAVLYSKSELFI